MATAEAKEVATSGLKGNHHRTASDDAVGQDPYSLTVSFGASDRQALVAA